MSSPGWKAIPFRHGFTYNGHPTGCAVALENLAIIEREDLLQRATELGRRLAEGFAELERHSAVVEARSFGFLGGLDIRVANEQDLADSLLEAGLIVRLLAGKIAVSPPLSATDADLERLLEILDEQLSSAAALD